jgi:hypothetical protein
VKARATKKKKESDAAKPGTRRTNPRKRTSKKDEAKKETARKTRSPSPS